MDLKLDEGSDWKRVKPEQAHRVTKNHGSSKTLLLEETELQSLLKSSEDEDRE